MKEQLIQIHNTLCKIATKGDDTISMAQSLIGLRNIIDQLMIEEESLRKEESDE